MGRLHGFHVRVIDLERSSWHELVVYGEALLVLIDYDVVECRRVVSGVQLGARNNKSVKLWRATPGFYELYALNHVLCGFDELLVRIPEELLIIEDQTAFDAALTAYQENT